MLLLTSTTVAGVKRWSASVCATVCLSVCLSVCLLNNEWFQSLQTWYREWSWDILQVLWFLGQKGKVKVTGSHSAETYWRRLSGRREFALPLSARRPVYYYIDQLYIGSTTTQRLFKTFVKWLWNVCKMLWSRRRVRRGSNFLDPTNPDPLVRDFQLPNIGCQKYANIRSRKNYKLLENTHYFITAKNTKSYFMHPTCPSND